jgi:hypothetical protein
MKRLAPIALLLACTAIALSGGAQQNAYMFRSSNFGIHLPSGFSLSPPIGRGSDVINWHFTNSVGSHLTFHMGGPCSPDGVKTNFKGFAAFEYRTNLIRRIVFHYSQFSHEEIERSNLEPPFYFYALTFRAANTNDEQALNRAVESLFLKGKESNQLLHRTQ